MDDHLNVSIKFPNKFDLLEKIVNYIYLRKFDKFINKNIIVKVLEILKIVNILDNLLNFCMKTRFEIKKESKQ